MGGQVSQSGSRLVDIFLDLLGIIVIKSIVKWFEIYFFI